MIRFVLKFILIIFILVGCEKKYMYLEPGSITTGQVSFRSLNGYQKTMNFLFSVPNKYTSEQSWPLIVALHGYGSNAVAFHDLWRPVTDSLGFVLLTPQGEDATEEGVGWSWGINAERTILTCMDAVRKTVHIDPRRVYLTGFSAGGRITYEFGFKHPHIFRGIAPLGARFNVKLEHLNNKRIRHLRVYIGHGTLEKNYWTDAAFAANILQQAGLKVKYVPYEGVGHDLPEPKEEELARILKFLDSRD